MQTELCWSWIGWLEFAEGGLAMIRRRQLLISGLLLTLALAAITGSVQAAQPSRHDAPPTTGPTLSAKIIAGCTLDPITQSRYIAYSADIDNTFNMPVSVFYRMLLESTDIYPFSPLWHLQDQTARTELVLAPGTTNLTGAFVHEYFPIEDLYYQVGFVLEQGPTANAPVVFYADTDFLCTMSGLK
jgi:hypothetical protein